MRICFVVQRYGEGVVGGAEKYVESMATGLAATGHDITVLTSCATSYADWADVHPPGRSVERGVTVHRFRVRAPRDNDRFIPLHLRAVDVWDAPLWPWAQERWSQTMGPDLLDVEPVLAEEAARSDATVLVGYHYAQTLRLTGVAAAFGATIVIPTAHPEGAFHVGRVAEMFQHADHVVSLAPEEGELIARTYGCGDRITVVPCPVDPIAPPGDDVVDTVLAEHGATRGRYAVVVGRVDPAKGSDDAVRFARAFRSAIDPGFELVVIGPGAPDAPTVDGVRATGFVDDESRIALVAGAGVLLQPSYMESFSLALIEGWLLQRPAMVQGRSRVLAGHVRRSGGGLAYTDYLSFEAALTTLLSRPDLAAGLAARGHRYALDEFAWDRIAPAFLDVVARTAEAGGRRVARETRVIG